MYSRNFLQIAYFIILTILIVSSISFAINSSDNISNNNSSSLPQGSVVVSNSTSGLSSIYVELDEGNVVNYNSTFSPLLRQDIVVGEPVVWKQTLTLTGTIPDNINLLNHKTEIGEDFLLDVDSYKIYQEGQLISNAPTFVINSTDLNQQFDIEYTTAPLFVDITCNTKTLSDILPENSEVIRGNLPLDSIIEKKCSLKIHHDTIIHYYNVTLDLDEFNPEDIKSIYYVEGDTFLDINNNEVFVPK